MKYIKRFSVAILTFIMTVSMSVGVLAKPAWNDYIGFDGKPGHTWYEAADGKMGKVTPTSWTCKMKTIGWGGVWGCQVWKNVNVKKGKKYRVKFKIKSTKMNKWVFFKFSTKAKTGYGKWIRLKKGKYQNIDVTFTSKYKCKTIYFGIGGDFGDREDEADIFEYAYRDGFHAISDADINNNNSNIAGKGTNIVVKKFSLKQVDKKKKPKKKCPCGCGCCN